MGSLCSDYDEREEMETWQELVKVAGVEAVGGDFGASMGTLLMVVQ